MFFFNLIIKFYQCIEHVFASIAYFAKKCIYLIWHIFSYFAYFVVDILHIYAHKQFHRRSFLIVHIHIRTSDSSFTLYVRLYQDNM